MVPICSTTLPGHVGQPATPQCHIPNQTQPAPFWRAFACALAGCTAKVRARQTAFGEVCRPLPYPQSARLLPRLACALNTPLFVHFMQTDQAPPALTLRGKKEASDIVQICAILRRLSKFTFQVLKTNNHTFLLKIHITSLNNQDIFISFILSHRL